VLTVRASGRIDDIVEVSNGYFNKAEVGYPAGTTGSLAFQPIELPVDIDRIDDDKGALAIP